MYQSISLTVESIISFVKNGDTHFVVHGHVAQTGDQVEHIISAATLDMSSCAVLARSKAGEYLAITYMDVDDAGHTLRRYAKIAVEIRLPVESAVAPMAPSVLLPTPPAPVQLPVEPVSAKLFDVL